MGIDRKAGEGISGAEEKTYKRTSVSSPKLRLKK